MTLLENYRRRLTVVQRMSEDKGVEEIAEILINLLEDLTALGALEEAEKELGFKGKTK